jgi:hypothetical protein
LSRASEGGQECGEERGAQTARESVCYWAKANSERSILVGGGGREEERNGSALRLKPFVLSATDRFDSIAFIITESRKFRQYIVHLHMETVYLGYSLLTVNPDYMVMSTLERDGGQLPNRERR